MRHAKTFEHAGRVIRYVDEGDGPPLLFVHAFPLRADMWAPQFAARPAGWRVLAPDLSGFGGSPRSAATPARHVRDHAADLLALLAAAASSTPAVIVGLSMGGYIAFECWRQRPDLVRGLVLADTRAEADGDEARQRRRDMQATAREQGMHAIAEAMLPNLLGATAQTTNPHLAVEVRALIEANEASGVIDALEVLRTRPDSRDMLARIACPTLVLVGEEDTLTPKPLAQAMADGIDGATLVIVPRAGHLSNLEHPVAFTGALTDWLTRSFGDGSPR